MLKCSGVSINDSQPNCALQVVLYWFVRPAIYFSLIYGAKGITTGFASESLMETAWHFIGFIKKLTLQKSEFLWDMILQNWNIYLGRLTDFLNQILQLKVDFKI